MSSAFKAADWVEENTSTTGTGDLTLAGATTGSHAISTMCADGDLFGYSITDGAGNTESGIGTYHSSGNTFSRTTIKSSTNGGAAVSWAAGTKTVRCTLLASSVEFNLAGRLAPNSFDDVSKSGDYTILASDKGKSFLCTATLALTLPSATDRFWFAVYNNSTSGYVTVGSVTRLLPGEYCRVASDGSSWYVLDGRLRVPLTSPDRLPVTANAADDEFFEAALDTGGTRFSGATAWAWNNQGSATATPGSGEMVLKDPANASVSIRTIEQALPGSGAWTYVAKVRIQGIFTNSMAVGIALRESATGKFELSELATASSIPSYFVNKFTNTSTFSATYASFQLSYGPIYMQVSYDGSTNLTFSLSLDGVNFVPITTHAKNAFFTTAPDKIGLAAFSNSSNKDVFGIYDWFRRTA